MQLLLIRLRRSAAAFPATVLLALAGCGDDPTENRPLPAEIRLLSPTSEMGTPGWPLPDSVVVEVLDAQGKPLSGASVTWTTSNAGGSIGRDGDTTNAEGRAAALWTLGLGEGDQTLSITAGQLDPITVRATATVFHAASVTVGSRFACALTGDGVAYCWGVNHLGQLGNGTAGDPILTPVAVAGDLRFTSLTASDTHACGLASGGEAYCWGSNDLGETGTGAAGGSVTAPTPVQTALRFTQISAQGIGFGNSSCALTAAGEAWCWGDNMFGQLGDGTTTGSAVPVRVQSDVPFGSIQIGYFHSCALATTGELWCWGEQEVNPGAFGASPPGLYTTPVILHEDFRFIRLSPGRNFTCALTPEQAAFCWGSDLSVGSLGQDQVIDGSPVPLPVVGGHSFVSISSPSFKETYGLTDDGAVYRWGSPGNDVSQTPPVLLARTGFLEMDSGQDPFSGSHGACGITVDSAVYCVDADGVIRGVPERVTP